MPKDSDKLEDLEGVTIVNKRFKDLRVIKCKSIILQNCEIEKLELHYCTNVKLKSSIVRDGLFIVDCIKTTQYDCTIKKGIYITGHDGVIYISGNSGDFESNSNIIAIDKISLRILLEKYCGSCPNIKCVKGCLFTKYRTAVGLKT